MLDLAMTIVIFLVLTGVFYVALSELFLRRTTQESQPEKSKKIYAGACISPQYWRE